MSEPRVIKKYPNRRLYDTVESRYITLADVRRLVVERIEFVVVDKKNNADITRSILLQVIAEQEHLAEPILSQEFMVNVIRAYGTSVQGMVSGHLDQNLKQIMSQQPAIRPPRIRSPAEESFKALYSDAFRREGSRRARRHEVSAADGGACAAAARTAGGRNRPLRPRGSPNHAALAFDHRARGRDLERCLKFLRR